MNDQSHLSAAVDTTGTGARHMQVWHSRPLWAGLALLGLLGLVACGGEAPDLDSSDEADGVPSDELELGTVEQAWSPVSCGRESTTANATFTGHIDPAHVSPQSYNNCTKSFVVDLFNLDANYSGPGAGGGEAAHLQVSWADTGASTQAACENTEGGAIFYKRVNNSWVDQTGQLYSTGQWIQTGPPLNISFCALPGAQFFGVQAGASYRIAATMRQISGTNPTRRVSFETVEPTIIH